MLFGLSIFISGLASAARGGAGAPADPTIQALSRSLALFAGLGYLAAFVPPRWLRDIGHRALAFDLMRSIALVTDRHRATRPVGRARRSAASSILGTSRIRITAGEDILAHDIDPELTERRADADHRAAALEVPDHPRRPRGGDALSPTWAVGRCSSRTTSRSSSCSGR